jgi:menaquinone-dependent protoporphyrinogen oxidase
MANVLIVYGTTEGQTRKIAGKLAEFASEYGHAATVVDAGAGSRALPHGRYDAVVVAASVHLGRHQVAVARLVRDNLKVLERLPAAFFSVSLSAAGQTSRQRRDAEKCADAFLRQTGWRPALVRPVAGALAYSRYGPLTRAMMRFIAWREGGDTDTARDFEYTDWDRLRRDLELFLTHAVPPAEKHGGRHLAGRS